MNTFAPGRACSSRIIHDARPADREQDQDEHQVLDPDHLVIGAEAEVAPYALALAGQLELLLVRWSPAARAPTGPGSWRPRYRSGRRRTSRRRRHTIVSSWRRAPWTRPWTITATTIAPTTPSTRPETMLGTSTRRLAAAGGCSAVCRRDRAHHAALPIGLARGPPRLAATQDAKLEAETTLTRDHM